MVSGYLRIILLYKVVFFIILTLSYSEIIFAQTVYVSNTGNDTNEGTIENPILTLKKAKELCENSSASSSTILLKGGETFTDHIPTVSQFDKNRTCAFLWDINKPLTISTYESNEKAHLYGGYYKHSGGPVAAIMITEPCKEDVLIENLSFKMWQEGAIIIFETEDVIIQNIKVEKSGPYYFTDDEADSFAGAGIYLKNSIRILVDNVEMSNVHNNRGDRGGLHGFYCVRLGDSEIKNCVLTNISGSAFKIRREPRGRGPNNIYIHDNECYYTGLSSNTPKDEDQQQGFLRYSGEFYSDGEPNCPSAITIENNIFHYPFCWDNEGEDCSSSRAVKCSVSNTTACGHNVCSNDTSIVHWKNNDILYNWEDSEKWTGRNILAPSNPTELIAVAVADNQIDLNWNHDLVNGERFIIQRKTGGTNFKALRIVDSSVTSFSDKSVAGAKEYTYRVKACNDASCSEYTNEASALVTGIGHGADRITSLEEQFYLEQNYPNPFNPTTEIVFSLPKYDHTALTIYNSIGEVVEKLINKDMNAGKHKISFNANNLSAGIYLYHLQSGILSMSKKMIIIK